MSQLPNTPKNSDKKEVVKNQGLNQNDVIEERVELRQSYNPESVNSNPSLKSKILDKVKGIGSFGKTGWDTLFSRWDIGLENVVNTMKQPFTKKNVILEKKVSNTSDRVSTIETTETDDSQQTAANVMRHIEIFGPDKPYDFANLIKVDKQAKAKKEAEKNPERLEHPTNIENKLNSTLLMLKTIQFEENSLGLLGEKVNKLQAEYNETIRNDGDNKNKIDYIIEKYSEQNDSYVAMKRSFEESKIGAREAIMEISKGLELILNEKKVNPNGEIKKVNRSSQDMFTIEESIIPKLHSIGVAIKENMQTRKWDVIIPNEFSKITTPSNQNIALDTTHLEIEKAKDYSEQAIISSKFLLNDPRFAEVGKSRNENMYNILSDDYDKLAKYYDSNIESDLNEADLKNLKNRIKYTTERLANWKPENQKNTVTSVKDQIAMKLKTFDAIKDLKKYGLEYTQDKKTGAYDINFSGIVATELSTKDNSLVDENSEYSVHNTKPADYDVNFGAQKQVEPIMQSDFSLEGDLQAVQTYDDATENEQEPVLPQIKSGIEKFKDFTANLRSPIDKQDTIILQSEIDKHLLKNTFAGNDYFLGSILNGEFSFKCVTEEVFNENNDKAKLQIPYPYKGDTSFAAEASLNIYKKLNIRSYGEIPHVNPNMIKGGVTKSTSQDRWGEAY